MESARNARRGVNKWTPRSVKEIALPGEEWRVIPSEPQYRASSLGRIFSTISSRVLKPGTNLKGYFSVAPHCRTRSVHVLVMEAFAGPCPDGLVIRHLDGNPKNNAVVNLRYGTPSENAYDRRGHGTDPEARKTHCPRGHPYDEHNTRFRPNVVSRGCRACEKILRDERHAFVKAGGEVPATVKHGASAYSSWGCRCEICVAAKAEVNAKQWARAAAKRAA